MPRTSSQIARRDCGSEAGGEFVEEDHFRLVDECQRNEQPLLLPSGQRHEPGVPLLGETELNEEPVTSATGFRYSAAHRYTASQTLIRLLELRLLQLDADRS
jgi:hypothetical protein